MNLESQDSEFGEKAPGDPIDNKAETPEERADGQTAEEKDGERIEPLAPPEVPEEVAAPGSSGDLKKEGSIASSFEEKEPVYAFQWTFDREKEADLQATRKRKKRSVILYTAIVVSTFALAIAVLALVLTFSPAFRRDSAPETISEKVSSLSGILSFSGSEIPGGGLPTEAVAAKAVPSAVSIVVSGEKGSGVGSGVVYSSDGYIITNSHVVNGMSRISVRTCDGKRYPAVLVGESEDGDIALLKIKAEGLVPAVFANSDNILLGETVCAVGTPGGIEFSESVTRGIISCKKRAVKIYDQKSGALDHTLLLIQFDASVNPGNSGGALVNANGEVIGIVVSKTVHFENSYHFYYYVEGMGFAIPSNVVLSTVEALKKQEEPDFTNYLIPASRLGISGEETSTANGDARDGIRVKGFTSDAFDAARKFQIGDIIVSVEGMRVSEMKSFRTFLEDYAPGTRLSFTVYRNGIERSLSVELGSDALASS